jgi:NADH:ubiquinone oxidoreductase subunit 5 (subunit L)/multisubunit Na+/H+ antiporter MnhA subunit
MSGVIIKIGIYGILRMILLIHTNYLALGYFILIVSVITGVYGVMLAIVQHNLKRLLAYHSIENIGIIGIGIGLGCIGMGNGNKPLAILGLLGAFLHTLNHSLFKSLLFYCAGNVYQSTHTMNIDMLGGAGKHMKHTAFLFLIAALAICGFPPFNGFVSEFLIYSGLFNGLKGASLPYLSVLALSILGLSLIGGLAMLCFTKAFGTVFLGQARQPKHIPGQEKFSLRNVPLYVIAALILIIGIFPTVFFNALKQPLLLFTSSIQEGNVFLRNETVEVIQLVGYSAVAFIGLSALIYFVRNLSGNREATTEPTWGCGYIAPGTRLQYTASSFVRNYRKLAEPLLLIDKHKKDIEGIFPVKGRAWHETHPGDKTEEYLILRPLRKLRNWLGRMTFLQNGRPQVYILYGATFIMLIIAIPAFIDLIKTLIQFLKTL